MAKVLALNSKGEITYCTVSPENRGKGRCNHVKHQEPWESPEDFIKRINNEILVEKENSATSDIDILNQSKEITQEEINSLATQIDKIAGVKLTENNFKEVLNSLSPDQVTEITKLAFEAAPLFSIPITDENYEDENIKNKLYFANLPAYGIAGNSSSIAQMFDKVGESHTSYGTVNVEHSYKEGLTPEEYFARQFNARDAEINKGVGTAKPGHCIMENSLVNVIKDGYNTKILWQEVEIGDKFIDGSEVVELSNWTMKPCYEIKIRNFDKIVVSNDHLIYGEIYLNNSLIDNLEKSHISRINVGELDEKWICAEDYYEFYKLRAYIKVNEENPIEYIKPYKNLEPQKVRCISTNTGFYETNGLTHHNTARKLFYCMSDTQVVDDCGGPHIDALHCSMPEGHICVKCAKLTKGGEKIKTNTLVGGLVSTNMSEALTQLSMKQKHVGSAEVTSQLNTSSVIMSTLDGWGTSPIIKEMVKAKTTEERRKILADGLKEQYSNAGIAQDDFNIQMVARKMTSYKRDKYGLRPVNPNECCDIVSMEAVGYYGNIFKVSELSSGYKHLTFPQKQNIRKDAANEILR